jgi:hypothetical protein
MIKSLALQPVLVCPECEDAGLDPEFKIDYSEFRQLEQGLSFNQPGSKSKVKCPRGHSPIFDKHDADVKGAGPLYEAWNALEEFQNQEQES